MGRRLRPGRLGRLRLDLGLDALVGGRLLAALGRELLKAPRLGPAYEERIEAEWGLTDPLRDDAPRVAGERATASAGSRSTARATRARR